MRAVYLTGETLYLRALQSSDKEIAAAWHQSPFPIGADRAEEILKEAHGDPEEARRWLLAIARVADDEVVGSVLIVFWRHEANVTFHFAPSVAEPDPLHAEALRLVVAWLRDDHEELLIETYIPADMPATLAAAEEVGMTPRARLRECIARPGHRVDLIFAQWVHPMVEEANA